MALTRRSILKMLGGAMGSIAVSGCVRRPAVTPRGLCGALREVDAAHPASATKAELAMHFRELECLTLAVIAGRDQDESLAREVTRRFSHLHNMLAAAPYTRPVAEAWRRFYAVTARMHEVRNERARGSGIPVYAYNGHQHAARLWLDEVAQRGPLGPLLHFDSHDDMRGLPHAADVAREATRLGRGDDERRAALARLRRLVDDHATPVSAGVLGTAATNVVWAAPSWAGTMQFIRRPFLYADVDLGAGRVFQLLHDPQADRTNGAFERPSTRWIDTARLTRDQRQGLTLQRPIELSFIQTYPWTKAALPALERAIPKGRFILDIDMDYFLTVDHESGFDRRLRAAQREMNGLRAYEQALVIARQLLDDRLVELERVLTDLRDAGRTPAMVTIADSTYRPFAPFLAGAGYWEYTPIEFAAHAHWSARRMLARVYKRHGIAAGV